MWLCKRVQVKTGKDKNGNALGWRGGVGVEPRGAGELGRGRREASSSLQANAQTKTVLAWCSSVMLSDWTTKAAGAGRRQLAVEGPELRRR